MGGASRFLGEGQRLLGAVLGSLCRGAAAFLGLGAFPRLHALLLALLVGVGGPLLRGRGDPHSLLASPHNILEARLTSSAAPWTALLLASLLVAAHPLLRPPVGVALRAAARLALSLLLARLGPALFRRMEAAIGSCWATPTPEGTLLLPHPDPETCQGAGHNWVGFSPAPQAFGLVYAGLGLAEEAAWIGRGLWGGRGLREEGKGRGLQRRRRAGPPRREWAELPVREVPGGWWAWPARREWAWPARREWAWPARREWAGPLRREWAGPPPPPSGREWAEPRWEGEEEEEEEGPSGARWAWPPRRPRPPARFWAEKPRFWAGRGRFVPEPPVFGVGGAEPGPEVGRFWPEVGHFEPEVSDSGQEVSDPRGDFGGAGPDMGWAGPGAEGAEPGAALCVLYLLNVGLLGLWHVLLGVTLAYRNTWARNAAGAALGWALWGVTYRAWFRWAWPGWG